MADYIAQLTDTKTGENIYPVTTPEAVRDEQGRSIKELITERDITDMNALASMVVATPTQQSFIERATPAGGIAYIPKVYGNSLKVVQMAGVTPSSGVLNGISYTINADGTIVLNGTASASTTIILDSKKHLAPSHKFLVYSGNNRAFPNYQGFDVHVYAGITYANDFYDNTGNGKIYTALGTHDGYQCTLVTREGESFSNEVFRPQFFDLTAMGMEDITTADEFAQRMGYPSIDAMPYIPYTEGTIKNLTATGIESRNAAGAVVASLPLNISGIVRADGTQLFPEGLRSAGSARDMVDRVNGRAEKRILVTDLGSLEWRKDTLSNGRWAFYQTNDIPEMKYTGQLDILCPKYPTVKLENAESGTYTRENIVFTKPNRQLFIVDMSFNTTAEFKAAMTGVPLYGELAEPETVTFSPMKAFYKTEQGGTERLTGEDSAPIVADMGYKE